ncbi:MAG: hypothetical protein LBK47_04935 [Prevotellaceae bacterium]|jgi:hypothetical protein|nr:hypothetical protein [Prevotellaceae bacterium]
MDKVSKYLKIFNYVVLGICVVVSLLFFILPDNTPKGKDGAMLFTTAYILMSIAVLLLIGFFILNMVEHPKKIKFVLMGAIVTAILVGACYILSTDTAVGLNNELTHSTSGATLRWTETGIIAAYILFGIAIVALILGGIRNSLK